MNIPDNYTIERERGVRWYDMPYKVYRNGTYVTETGTFWGARLKIKKDKRKRRMGTTTVWEEGPSSG